MIPLERVSSEQRENPVAHIFESLCAEVASVKTSTPIGRVTEIARGVLQVSGLGKIARQGDRVLIDERLEGEVLTLTPDAIAVLTEGVPEGMTLGAEVALLGPAELAPSDAWIGRIIDPYGRAMDGARVLRGRESRSIRAPAPAAAQRRRLGARLSSSVAVFDTLLPLVRGQRIGLFAGSGVGKSSLLAKFARGIQADVVVIALVGERGRELREFVEKTLGPQGMSRSVIVTATSDQSALARRRCALSAMTVAEHFRAQGMHVLLLVDSITRFAEAHREVALASGEVATLKGYPPSVAQEIMSLAERAGPGPEGEGDITAVFSVLVAGSDMEETVADILRGVLDGHVVMDRKIAERGRYPAIDLLRSVSRSLPDAATEEENRLIADARHVLGTWDRAELMIQAGLYSKGSDPMIDRAIKIWPALDGFLAEDAPLEGISGSFARLAQVLAKS